MTAAEHPDPTASVFTLQERVTLAGLEGSLTWILDEVRALARGQEPVDGITPGEWSQMADALDDWRAATTDLLDAIAKQKDGGR